MAQRPKYVRLDFGNVSEAEAELSEHVSRRQLAANERLLRLFDLANIPKGVEPGTRYSDTGNFAAEWSVEKLHKRLRVGPYARLLPERGEVVGGVSLAALGSEELGTQPFIFDEIPTDIRWQVESYNEPEGWTNTVAYVLSYTRALPDGRVAVADAEVGLRISYNGDESRLPEVDVYRRDHILVDGGHVMNTMGTTQSIVARDIDRFVRDFDQLMPKEEPKPTAKQHSLHYPRPTSKGKFIK